MSFISLLLTFVGSWPAGHCRHTSPSFHRPCTAAVPPQASTLRHTHIHLKHTQGPESVEVGFIMVVRTHTVTYVPPNQGQNHVYREEDESWAAKVVPHLLQCILLCTYDLKETAHTHTQRERWKWLICGSTLMWWWCEANNVTCNRHNSRLYKPKPACKACKKKQKTGDPSHFCTQSALTWVTGS